MSLDRKKKKSRRNRKLTRKLVESCSFFLFCWWHNMAQKDSWSGQHESHESHETVPFWPRVVETCWTTLEHVGIVELHIRTYVEHEKPDEIKWASPQCKNCLLNKNKQLSWEPFLRSGGYRSRGMLETVHKPAHHSVHDKCGCPKSDP